MGIIFPECRDGGMADTGDLFNLSGKARKSLLESPKFGGNPFKKVN